MSTLLYYFIGWPFIMFGLVAEFLVWVFFSNGRWKQQRTQPNLVKHWQEEAIEARRQLRELEYKSRRIEENQKERKT